MPVRVVIDNAVLKGSLDDTMLQLVATVYPDGGGGEFRVMAPPKATGDALDWAGQWEVRITDTESFSFGSDITVIDCRRPTVLELVARELENDKMDSDIWNWGTHPDARFYVAQVCMRGHVQSSGGLDKFKRDEHCPKCGDPSIDRCVNCNAPIRGGRVMQSPLEYARPNFCYKCGRPYPWMADCLATARDLLWHDDKLTEDDRKKLWDILQYVMSDPKAGLVPAKTKLFEIVVARALPATKDFFADLLAKIAVESMK